MKIQIVYDNESIHPMLKPDWGFAAVVDYRGKRILFDTGGNGSILLHNLLAMKIDPQTIDEIVISHPDFDHIGGLSHILNENERAKVHLPNSFRGVHYPNEIRHYKTAEVIYPGVFTTGELSSKSNPCQREQSLAFQTSEGLVILVGCSHPGADAFMKSLERFGKPFALIGGLHDFDRLKALSVLEKICATHCTQKKEEILALYPEKSVFGGCGVILEFQD